MGLREPASDITENQFVSFCSIVIKVRI